MTIGADGRRTTGSTDGGSVMPMTTILIVFLMIGCWALLSASQQWNARREANAVAAAAARAGAQGDGAALRSSQVLDPASAAERAHAILTSSGATGTVAINGATVTVTAHVAVDYAFPSAGFPAIVGGTASATATRGVTAGSP